MPIYAFQCAECGHSFDRLQKMSDPDPETCPSCGAHQVRRQLTAPSFRLSGSGWYETDFKKDGDTKRNLAGKDEAPKTEVKEAKAETKPTDSKPAPATKPEGGTN
jgi:putative FmdB family regulatory protein